MKTCESCPDRAFATQEGLDAHLEVVHGEEARFFSAKERKKHAKSGAAMSDGSFPIKNATDLKNAIRLAGHAKNPAAAKAHIKKRAKALGLTKSLPADWASNDCPECDRTFRSEDALADHAETVHTFSDMQRLVSDRVRETYGGERVYVYVEEMSTDWVAFSVEKSNDQNLYKRRT